METKLFDQPIVTSVREIDFTRLTKEDQYKLFVILCRLESGNPYNEDISFVDGLDIILEYADSIFNSQKAGDE